MTDIFRSKCNQAMKFGQLIKYNKKKNFIEESYRKCGGDTIPDPFLKNQNWAYLWINSLKFYTASLLLYAKLRTIKIY